MLFSKHVICTTVANASMKDSLVEAAKAVASGPAEERKNFRSLGKQNTHGRATKLDRICEQRFTVPTIYMRQNACQGSYSIAGYYLS